METERVVVVTMEVSFSESEDLEGLPKIFAARENRIGIHGYGPTRDAAKEHLEKVLEVLLIQLARKGILEDKLDSVGVQWRWEIPDEDQGISPMISGFTMPSLTVFDSKGSVVERGIRWGALSETPLVTDSHIPIPA